MKGFKEIHLEVLALNQVESWRPLLCAQRAVLQIQEKVRLPLSHTGGFEAALPEEGSVDFQAYDGRFSRIQDRELKLEMAISRFLYPVQLGEKARIFYEEFLKKRFRPASLQLVSGSWNRYGVIPDRVEALLGLKTMDRFLKKELLERAALCHQPEFTALILEMAESGGKSEVTERGEKTERDWAAILWKFAAGELYRRKPELEFFCGILKFCQVEKSESDAYFVEKCPKYEKNMEKSFFLAGTDEIQVCYREYVGESYTRKELSRAYAHMLFHCLYLHPFSRKKNGKWTDLACDIAVEYVVDQIFGPWERYTWERQWVYDTLRRWETVLTSERIEKNLFRLKEAGAAGLDFEEWSQDSLEQWLDQLSQWFVRDDHSTWTCQEIQPDHSGFGNGRQKILLESDSRQKAVDQWTMAGKGLLQAGQKKAGKRSAAAGHEQEEAKLKKRQGYDYHEFLRQFMVLREDRILDLDSYDPVYYTYGLNTYGSIPLVEPLETKEVMRLEELVIVIDTSGSCSGKLVRFFLEETWSVFGQSENFFDQFQVRILQCDAVVQEDVKLTSLQDAEQYMKHLVIRGGGGTDFREAFSYIRKLQKKGELMHLKGILYFTDGFGTYPAQPPGCKTAFIFLKARFGQVEVPYWADKLLLELPEGADWEPEYTGGFQVNILR